MADTAAVRRRPRRGMYLLPSFFTAGNIAIGYFAIVQALEGSAADPRRFDHAALAILFAIPFDAIDGRVARMTNTASDFGRELDSLADVITFGVAPSILAYTWGFRCLDPSTPHVLKHKLLQLGVAVCFLFLLCGAARLARFNVSVNPEPKNPGRPGRKYFVGMPIPAAAGLLAAFVHMVNGDPVLKWQWSVGWLGMVGLAGFLMVSTWRFWSGKEINFGTAHPFRIVVLLAVVIVVLALFSEQALIAAGLMYLVSGLLARIAYGMARRRNRRVLA